jgi:hypothetical protein
MDIITMTELAKINYKIGLEYEKEQLRLKKGIEAKQLLEKIEARNKKCDQLKKFMAADREILTENLSTNPHHRIRSKFDDVDKKCIDSIVENDKNISNFTFVTISLVGYDKYNNERWKDVKRSLDSGEIAGDESDYTMSFDGDKFNTQFVFY